MSNSDWSHTIAVDMPVDESWAFARELARLVGVPFRVVAGDGRAHVPRWRRMLLYVSVGLKLFTHRHQMRVLVCWQQFFGLMFVWFCALFHVKKRTWLAVMTFIYRPKHGLLGRIYRHWVKSVLASGYIDRVLVYSRHEVKHYSQELDVPEALFSFAPLALDAMPETPTADDGYLFSTGKSNRDYDFLIKALAGTQHRLVIACDELSLPAVGNVTVHRNAFGTDMLALMARARVVVIALADDQVSSGQLVALQAMALGKPVVATYSLALVDYVADGVTGFLVEKQADALLEAIERLDRDPALRHRMGEAAQQLISSRHTLARLACRTLQLGECRITPDDTDECSAD